MIARLACALLLTLAPCASRSVDAPAEREASDAAQPEDREASDASDGEADPPESECPAPDTRCDGYGATCTSGRTHCTCTNPCSGVELPPEESYLRWACRDRDPACPDEVPTAGQACARSGLRCGWGTCGGFSAICEREIWQVHESPVPP